MVVDFTVYKKNSPNDRITLYMTKREFLDTVSSVEPIDGIVELTDDYVNRNRKVFAQLVCKFRYGREQDEVMGLNFQRELILKTVQIHPVQKVDLMMTKMQEILLKKLSHNAFPFVLKMPTNSPASVVLQQKADDNSQPCGVQYFVKVFAAESEASGGNKRSTVSFGIRKIQYATPKKEIQPCSIVRKELSMSPGELELEITLDKQFYHHGDKIAVNICIRNNSNKAVKKIKATVQQGIEVGLFKNGQLRNTISSMESTEGCPIQSGSSVQETIYLLPALISNINKAGVAVEGDVRKRDETYLASSTILASPENRHAFGVVVSYSVKVKAVMGTLGGDVSAEVPFILMQPKHAAQIQQVSEVYECQNENKIVDY